MSFGSGERESAMYGQADNWGGPDNGIDLVGQIGTVDTASKTYKISEDGWLAIFIVTALVLLWLLGGVAFRGHRIG